MRVGEVITKDKVSALDFAFSAVDLLLIPDSRSTSYVIIIAGVVQHLLRIICGVILMVVPSLDSLDRPEHQNDGLIILDEKRLTG